MWVAEGEVGALVAGGDDAAGAAARQALLCAVHGHPAACCVLWLSLAHLHAWGRLPDAVLHRCGCREPLNIRCWGAFVEGDSPSSPLGTPLIPSYQRIQHKVPVRTWS